MFYMVYNGSSLNTAPYVASMVTAIYTYYLALGATHCKDKTVQNGCPMPLSQARDHCTLNEVLACSNTISTQS